MSVSIAKYQHQPHAVAKKSFNEKDFRKMQCFKLGLWNLLFLFCHLPYFVFSGNQELFSNLLGRMLKDKYLIDCEIVLVNAEYNNNNKSEENIQAPYYNIDAGDYKDSSGIFSVVRSTSTGNFVPKLKRLSDIHKFNYKTCGVALIYISKVSADLPEWLFEVLTPPYVPIIRKDEDPFVFLFSNRKDAEEILLSKRFGSKIRFKIGIHASDEIENGNLVINTVDLFGNAGEPVIKAIQMTRLGVESLFPDSTGNFKGKKIRVANPKAPSHFEMQPLPGGKGNRAVRGIYKAWLDIMMVRFNFTVDLFLSSYFGGTGKRLKNNGTWLGAVGDVLYERADMASFNGHIYNRHTVVDWSAPVTYEWMAFITHKPKSYFSTSAIFKPFPLVLWLGFFVSIIAIISTLKVLVRFDFGSPKSPLSVSGAVWFLLSSFLEQDANYYVCILELPQVRALIMFWLLFAMILSTAYRGKLVSLIAFPGLSWVPTNFEELAYSNYRVGLNTLGKGGAVYSVLSTSNSPVYQLIFERLEIYPDSVKCLSEALHHDFGCIMVKSIGDVVAYKNFTDKFGRSPFQESDNMALFHADGYIWEKKAVFRRNMDKITWSIMESGLSGRWFQTDLDSLKQKRLAWEKETGNMTVIPGLADGPSKLKAAQLEGLFWLFVTGLTFALITLLTEKFRPIYHENRLNKIFSISIAQVFVNNIKASQAKRTLNKSHPIF